MRTPCRLVVAVAMLLWGMAAGLTEPVPTPAVMVAPVPRATTESCANGTVIHHIPREAVERCVGGTRSAPTPLLTPGSTLVIPAERYVDPAAGRWWRPRLEIRPAPSRPQLRLRRFSPPDTYQPKAQPRLELKLPLGRKRRPLVDIQIVPQAAP